MSDQETEILREKSTELRKFLAAFEGELVSEDLRAKVLSLVPVFLKLRELGSALIPLPTNIKARERILFYLIKYPLAIINGNELLVVSGIQEYARRVRELRVEFGWSIISGVTAKAMLEQEEFLLETADVSKMKPDDYILLSATQDKEAALRWNVANEIRKQKNVGVRDKILEFLQKNVTKAVSGEELRYIANDKTEWARRVRELRTECGWPIATRQTGRPDLPIGVYLLESMRQSPDHTRVIPDPVRRTVLRRDGHKCADCGWTHAEWNPSDARNLEIHHKHAHVEGGANTEENLVTLCTVCHDIRHKK